MHCSFWLLTENLHQNQSHFSSFDYFYAALVQYLEAIFTHLSIKLLFAASVQLETSRSNSPLTIFRGRFTVASDHALNPATKSSISLNIPS